MSGFSDYDRWKLRSDRDEEPQEEPIEPLFTCTLCGAEFEEKDIEADGCRDPGCPMQVFRP